MNNRKILCCVTLLSLGYVTIPAFAQDPSEPRITQDIKKVFGVESGKKTPGGKQKIKITLGEARKNGESPYVVMARWKLDGGLHYDASGVSILKGPDLDKPDNALSAAEKAYKAIHKGIYYQMPAWRGASVEQLKAPDGSLLPELILQNNAGFSLTSVSIVDLGNQTSTVELLDQTFSEAGADIALDISGEMNGGGVELTLGEKETIVVSSNGDAAPAEKDVVEQLKSAGLNASTSGSSLTPDLGAKENILREREFFDGREIFIAKPNISSITLNNHDGSVGLITKIKFEEQEVEVSYFWVVPVTILVVAGSLVIMALIRRRKQAQQGTP